MTIFEGSREKIVSFWYCKFCQHRDKPECDEPCDDCLDNPTNVDSRRPIHFKDNGSLTSFLKRSKGE